MKLLAKGGMGAAFSVTKVDDFSRRGVPICFNLYLILLTVQRNLWGGVARTGECTVTTIDDFLSPRQDESEKSS